MEQITKLSINVLKVHPQNQEFFDDIEGEQYEKFKKSIQEDGIITPLTVSPDMTIISGHQRYKACKDLGIDLVPVIIREDFINEDDKLKKLLAANFGRLKNNPVKQGKVYSEYVKLCGITHGGSRVQNAPLTQERIAKELGVGVDTLKRLKRLQTLSPELQQLIEDGSVKYTTALNVYAKLSSVEQSLLIEELGKEQIAEMTQKQTEQYILENQKLKKELQQEKNKPSKTIEIDNTDYFTINKLKQDLQDSKNKMLFLEKDKNLLEEQVKLLKKQSDLYEKDSKEYEELKIQMELLTKQKDDISRQINSATELSRLVVEIEDLLKNKLAPIKYSRSLIDMKDDEIVLSNLSEILNCVIEWYEEMQKYINTNNKNIINVEVL